jgi:hypothetical protein
VGAAAAQGALKAAGNLGGAALDEVRRAATGVIGGVKVEVSQ